MEKYYVVTDWLKQMKNKNLCKFATFDIKEFYPSIKECLLKNAHKFHRVTYRNIRNRQSNNIPR